MSQTICPIKQTQLVEVIPTFAANFFIALKIFHRPIVIARRVKSFSEQINRLKEKAEIFIIIFGKLNHVKFCLVDFTFVQKFCHIIKQHVDMGGNFVSFGRDLFCSAGFGKSAAKSA